MSKNNFLKNIAEKRPEFIYFVLLFISILYYFKNTLLTNSFLGNCDTLFALTFSKYYLNFIQAKISGTPLFHFMYPFTKGAVFGETSFLASLFIIFFYKVLGTEIATYYSTITTIFFLNGVTCFYFLYHYFKDKSVAIGLSLVFVYLQFNLANIDSIQIIMWFPAFLAFSYLLVFNQNIKKRTLTISIFFLSSQLYFSAYIFLFSVIIWIFLLLKDEIYLKISFSLYIKAIFFLILFISPFVFLYFSTLSSSNFINPWNPKYISEMHSLDIKDLLRKLPGNIYNMEGNRETYQVQRIETDKFKGSTFDSYKEPLTVKGFKIDPSIRSFFGPDDIINFPFVRRSAFIGFFIYLLAIFGFKKSKIRDRIYLIVLFFIGLIFSLGPFEKSFLIIPNLMKPLYDHFYLANFFRIPSRAFYISIFSLLILCGYGLIYMRSKGLKKTFWLFIFVILLENWNWGMKLYPNKITPTENYDTLLKDEPSSSNILHLPSDLGLTFLGDDRPVFSYSREIIYINKANYHHHNIFNGVQGYFPIERITTNNEVKTLINSPILPKYFSENHLDLIIFHKDLSLTKQEQNILPKLLNKEFLQNIMETDDTIVFKVKY